MSCSSPQSRPLMLAVTLEMQGSLSVLSRLHLLAIARNVGSVHPLIVSSMSLPFGSTPSVSLLSIGRVHYSIKSGPCSRETYHKYWSREFLLEPKEEENACQIRRAILRVRNGTVEDVFRSLQCDESCSRMRLTSNLVDSLLRRFGDDWKSALGFFQWAGLQLGYEHTSYAYDNMVDLLGKMRQIDRMHDLVGKMHDRGLVSLETVAKIMRRLAGAGRWRDAIKVFDDLGSMGIDKDTQSMNVLLDTLCKERRVGVAREVFLELKAHIPPDAYTFNIFVHGWCNAGRIDEAKWTILEMKGCGFHPSVITYSTILQAHCNRSDFGKVYELLDEMLTEGCPPNVVTYTTIMRSLGKFQEFEQAMDIVKRMKSSGCKPDTLFYNSLINILGRAGRLHEASHIFDVEMQINGVDRNLSTYNTMISIFCLHHQEHNALKVLKEMEDSSCKPDLLTYSPLLKLCFNSGKVDDHLQSLLGDIIDKHHLSLDLATYTLLIHGLCKVGKIERACLLFEEMICRDILPRKRTCKLLMIEAEERNMDGAVESIKSLMKQTDESISKY